MPAKRSREWRRLAAQCLAVAKQTDDVQVRTTLVEMAQRWFELAQRAEQESRNLRVLQAAIGQELRTLYAVPHHLPHKVLAVLIQLSGESCAR
jgi:hypothetical protein